MTRLQHDNLAAGAPRFPADVLGLESGRVSDTVHTDRIVECLLNGPGLDERCTMQPSPRYADPAPIRALNPT